MKLTTPFTDEVIPMLHSGDKVELSGMILVARDAAHKRIVEALDRGEKLPVDVRGQVIYHMGVMAEKAACRHLQVLGPVMPPGDNRDASRLGSETR